MNVDEVLQKNKLLEEENMKLRNELNETKERLKKYTAPAYKKEYYEKNKAAIKERIKKQKQNYTPTPEQKKQWAKNAYLKKKERLKTEKEAVLNVENI